MDPEARALVTLHNGKLTVCILSHQRISQQPIWGISAVEKTHYPCNKVTFRFRFSIEAHAASYTMVAISQFTLILYNIYMDLVV